MVNHFLSWFGFTEEPSELVDWEIFYIFLFLFLFWIRGGAFRIDRSLDISLHVPTVRVIDRGVRVIGKTILTQRNMFLKRVAF